VTEDYSPLVGFNANVICILISVDYFTAASTFWYYIEQRRCTNVTKFVQVHCSVFSGRSGNHFFHQVSLILWFYMFLASYRVLQLALNDLRAYCIGSLNFVHILTVLFLDLVTDTSTTLIPSKSSSFSLLSQCKP
jgi:hypothetical protein